MLYYEYIFEQQVTEESRHCSFGHCEIVCCVFLFVVVLFFVFCVFFFLSFLSFIFIIKPVLLRCPEHQMTSLCQEGLSSATAPHGSLCSKFFITVVNLPDYQEIQTQSFLQIFKNK